MNKSKRLLLMSAALTAAGLQGCATTGPDEGTQAELDAMQQEVEAMQMAVKAKDKRIVELEQASQSVPVMQQGESLLPPDAKAGECYARVWVPAVYRDFSKEVLVKEASDRVETVPARHEWVEERVLVKEASSRFVEVPAVYGTEEETIQVREATRTWKTGLENNAAPSSPEMLAAARAGGIDLDSASHGTCFHEHYRPAQFETEQQQVLLSEASEEVSVSDAQYQWVEKQVLVKEAFSELREVPAVYDWAEEQVIDKPAHTIWQKGTGPIQRIDEATGEIMCLVEVPATYKALRKRVLVSPATTETVEFPAEYRTVKVRELIEGPVENKGEIPAQYGTVELTKKVADPTFIWHEVHNREEPRYTRTGAKICVVEQPAQYKTVSRRVVTSPATVRELEIPAEYETVRVRKLVSGPQENRIAIPAEYKTVALRELEKEGHMQWRSILCKTNMTGTRISQIQSALKQAGYDPGPIDGSIGMETMSAVNAFQRDKGLPVDRYLNVETLNMLGVSAQ